MLTHPLLIESHRSQVLTIYQYTIRSAVSNVNPFRGLWLSHPLCITPCGFTGYVWAKGAFVVCRLPRPQLTFALSWTIFEYKLVTSMWEVGAAKDAMILMMRWRGWKQTRNVTLSRGWLRNAMMLTLRSRTDGTRNAKEVVLVIPHVYIES